MGAYDRFKTADIMGARQYIEAGNHVLLVRRAMQGPSKNPTKKNQENTIIEFKVVESDTMKVGITCSLVETDAQQGYLGNVLAFIAGILGYDVDVMREDPEFDAIFGDSFGTDQILCDMLIRCVAQQVKTQSGGDYTAKTWEPVAAHEYEKWNLIAPNGAWTGDDEEAAA